jgi:hypothetical protein
MPRLYLDLPPQNYGTGVFRSDGAGIAGNFGIGLFYKGAEFWHP